MHGTRSKGPPEFQAQPDISKYLRQTRRRYLENLIMENQGQNQNQGEQQRNEQPREQRFFGDVYHQTYTQDPDVRGITAESYLIPPALISLIQNGKAFHGYENEDPQDHLRAFNYLSNTCKLAGVSQDDIKRVLFPFSLRDRALTWYATSGGDRCQTFNELATEFIHKYFPPSKMEELRNAVHMFRKREDESFKDAWDRYQELLKKCPPKLVESGYELQLFYNGLPVEDRNLVNASAAGGTIIGKAYNEVRQLFDTIAKNNNTAPVRSRIDRPGAIVESKATEDLAAQMAMLTAQFSAFLKTQPPKPPVQCSFCNEQHTFEQCPQMAEVNAIRNFQRNQGFSNWPARPQNSSQEQSNWNAAPNQWNSNQNQWNQGQSSSGWQNQQPRQSWNQQNANQ